MGKAFSQVNHPQVFQPKKQLGQHFLRLKSVLAKIIETAVLKNEDLVLEIGPGLGVLTEKLAEKAGRVVAIEKDPRLIPLLKEKFKDSKNVEIVEGDVRFLGTSNKKNVGGRTSHIFKAANPCYLLPATGYKVVANLPYYAATHIIRQFLESPCPPKLMVLMLQKEVAQRICACPSKLRERRRAKPPRRRQGYGGQAKMTLLAVSVQFYAKAQIISYVSKDAFWPQPKVDSAIIKIVPRRFRVRVPRQFRDQFFRIAKAGFSQPRKQLLNNLSKGLRLSKEKVQAWLLKNNLSPKQRAESLTLDNWLALTKTFVLQ